MSHHFLIYCSYFTQNQTKMAKTISDEQMKLSIIINGNEAQKQLFDLEKSTKSLKENLSALTKEEKKRQLEFEKANGAYMKNKTSLNEVENSMKALNRQYDIENSKLKKIESQLGNTSVEFKYQKKVVDDLEVSGVKLWNQQSKLQSAQIKLSPVLEKSRSSLHETKNAVNALNKSITENTLKASELRGSMKLTDMTLSQLNQKATILRMTLKNLVPDSADFKKYQAELDQVNTRLSELKGKSLTAKTSIGSLADSFNRYQGMALAAVATLTGVVLSIQKIIDINGKLSDAQSDVMKTTEMTKVEVDELTKSFGLLQTRTSRIDLLGIAEQGGRIGIAKAEIGDFVAVMNKASVSLGDSFTGGAEEVANKLGKIKFLFEQTKDMNVDQAYNSIGSAINDLGANGVASEANIAEFTTRIGSLTDVLKPTIQETLALGTAFEESGIEAEVSARAYGIFMKQASTETGKFAKVMGISEQKVKDMINSNPLEFMLQFSQGMKGMNATDTAKTLDALGISADGANKVIGAMGNNTARFRELMELSNNSFASGTSLINEYELKNNNLAATLEKISKTVSGWFSSETFIKWLTVAVDGLAKFIGATDDADGRSDAWKNTLIFTAKIIGIVSAAIITNIGWQKLVVLWTNRNTEANLLHTIGQKANAFATGLATIATQAQAVAVNWATGQTVAMKEAQIALGLAMKTTPWGFILSAISAIAVAYVMFKDNVEVASEVQKEFANIHNEATKNIAKQKSELELLTKVAQDNSVAQEKRLEAIKKLNEIIPDHIGILTLENIKNQEGLNILKAYTDEIYKNARARAVKSSYDKLVEEQVSVEGKSLASYRSSTGEFFKGKVNPNLKSDADIKNWASEFTKKLKDKDGNLLKEGTKIFYEYRDLHYNNMKAELSGLLDDKNQELSIINAKIKALEPEVTNNTIKDLGNKDGGGISNYNPIGGTNKVGAGKGVSTKKYDDSYINNELKSAEDLYNLRKKVEETRISMMADGYEKDLALEKLNSAAKIQELTYQNTSFQNLQTKLNEDLLAAQKVGDNKKIASIKNQQALLTEKQKANNELICYEEEMQNKRIGIITEKAGKDLIEKENQTHEDLKQARETAFYNVLNSKERTEEQKKVLIDKFNDDELQLEKQYLFTKLDELNRIIAGEVINGIDFSLLSQEAKDKFIKHTELVQNAVSKIKAAKSGDGSKEIDLGLASGDKDILGFSQKQWEGFFTNLENGNIGIQTITMALGLATQAFAQMDQFMSASENASLKRSETSAEKKKTHLKKQLDSGVISQKKYDKEVTKIDQDLDAKKADIEYKQAKRQKALSIMNIAMNTAMAIMSVMSTGGGTRFADMGVTAAILTGIVTAMGALQIATVMAQPLPAKGYEQGLYQDYVTREQDGKKFKSSYGGKTRSGLVSKTSHFLVAENGPEMVIDNKAWRQMNPAVKDSLIRELRGVKGFEQGLYNQAVQRYEVPASSAATPSGGDAQMNQMMMSLIAENLAVLKDLRDKGTFAVMTNKDLKAMGYLKDGIDEYNNLRTKSKK